MNAAYTCRRLAAAEKTIIDRCSQLSTQVMKSFFLSILEVRGKEGGESPYISENVGAKCSLWFGIITMNILYMDYQVCNTEIFYEFGVMISCTDPE